ncbi:carbohydrate ABC transporter permease [Actinomadura viridis]|uniref:Multiple sugar transport system permease protein n=2 Tax=Actinomadura viridis TaxID=58110 RepID=A0A931GRM4_9ACTN|nr:sugar ABC transporter permease [Actinomadura viridis]MBG6093006.1 multiple sugar transport system permease protein [Actinomadura viridis]
MSSLGRTATGKAPAAPRPASGLLRRGGPAGRRGPRAAPPRRPRGAGRRGARIAWLFSAPFLVIFLGLYAGPLLAGLGMSVTDLRSTDVRDPFAVNGVGLDNYTRLFQDEVMRRAAANTAFFVVTAVPLTILMGLAAAVALHAGIERFRTPFRIGYFLPHVTSIVGIAVVWRFLLDPEAGLVNEGLAWIGIDGPAWLSDERTALPSLVVMAAWRGFGFDMVIFLAALQGIPRDLYEAADVDGAGAWARFRSITLPMLRPALLFTTVYSTIGFMQFMEEPLVMTKGGPDNATLSASLAIYQQFGVGNYGYAGAAASVLFTVIIALTFLQFRLMRAKHH